MMPNANVNFNNESLFESQIQETLERLQQFRADLTKPKTAQELEILERDIVQATDQLAGLLIGEQIQAAILSDELREDAKQLVNSYPKPMKNNGLKYVVIRTLRGEEVSIKVPYYCRKGKAGKKKRNGLYASLVLLGSHEHFTQALASEVNMLSVACYH